MKRPSAIKHATSMKVVIPTLNEESLEKQTLRTELLTPAKPVTSSVTHLSVFHELPKTSRLAFQEMKREFALFVDDRKEKSVHCRNLFNTAPQKSNTISRSGFKRVIFEFGARPIATSISKVWETMDTDKNGILDFSEFVCGRSLMQNFSEN